MAGVWAAFRRFRRGDGGAVLAFFVVLLPLLLLLGGFATDAALMNAQKRYTQSQADLAAQAAARHLPNAAEVRRVARAVVAANGRFGPVDVPDGDIIFGRIDQSGDFVSVADQGAATGATAVHVRVRSDYKPVLLAPVLARHQIELPRSAIAARSEAAQAVFVLRNRLLGVNTGNSALLNGLLGPLGLGLTTNVLSYEGLANLRLKGEDVLGLANLGLGAEVLTFDDVLAAPVAVNGILQGMVSEGYLPRAAVPAHVPSPATVSFADLLGMDPGLMVHAADILPDLEVSALDLLTTMASLASAPDQRLGVGAGLNLAPLAALDLKLGLIRPPVRVVASTTDDPRRRAELEQVELTASAQVAPLPALGALLSLDLSLEVAGATAEMLGIDCTTSPPEVSMAVTSWPAALDVKLGLLGAMAGKPSRALQPIEIASQSQTVTIVADQLPKVVQIDHRLELSGVTAGLSDVLTQLRADAQSERTAREQERTARQDERAQREAERQEEIRKHCLRNPLACLGGVLVGVVGGVIGTLGGVIDGLGAVIDGLTAVIADLTSLIDNLTQVIGNLVAQSQMLDGIVDQLLSALGIEVAQVEIVLEHVTCGGAGGVALVR